MDSVATIKTQTAVAPARKKRSLKPWFIGFIVVVLLVASALLAWKYMDAQKKLKKLTNPTEAAKAETDELIKKVGKIVILPGDETPTVATVVDASKLKGQAFFANAQNGDKVLMYIKAKKAFLYRPTTNKLVESAPINIDTANTTDSGTVSGASTTNTTPTKK